MPRNIGIKDIAKKAGVSSATVSRALSKPELVSAKNREKVLQAVAETGYTPNRFGASLRTQKSRNVVVVMPDITNQVNAGIIRAIEYEAGKQGYSVLLGDTQNKVERELHYGDLVSSGQADGILVFTPRIPFRLSKSQIDQKAYPPMVNSCEEIDSDEIYKVIIDNNAGGKKAVQHLLDLGHKKIAAILGPNRTPSTVQRLAGYTEALQDAGIEIIDDYIITGDYGHESGISAMQQLLSLKERPTAVFCFSDDMAIGAMNALSEAKIRIPQDISIIGFDDITYAKLVSPKLTTIRQPLEEIGKQSMRLLFELLQDKQPTQKKIELDFELVHRQSTGPLIR